MRCMYGRLAYLEDRPRHCLFIDHNKLDRGGIYPESPEEGQRSRQTEVFPCRTQREATEGGGDGYGITLGDQLFADAYLLHEISFLLLRRLWRLFVLELLEGITQLLGSDVL